MKSGFIKNDLFLVMVLCVHLIAGVFAWYTDWKYPFSPSKETAEFISKLPFENTLVIKNDYTEAPVGAYLNVKPYCPERGCMCSFFLLTKAGKRTLDVAQTLKESQSLANQSGKKSILVMENNIDPASQEIEVKKIFSSGEVNINDPPFYVYEIDPDSK